MKSCYGRRVRIYEHKESKDSIWAVSTITKYVDTGKTGRLVEIDVHNEHVMIEDEAGNLIKLFYKLVKLI